MKGFKRDERKSIRVGGEKSFVVNYRFTSRRFWL